MMVTESEILAASILVVDDQEPNILLLEQLLGDAGYTDVASTMNPQEVCALHRRNGYDLMLLDLQMPLMDGFQVMEGLKTNAADAYLPVLVITAQPGHKLRALQVGARDFISKPFDLIEVRTRIRNMLEVRLLYKRLANYNQVLEQTVQERTAELRESEARYRSLTEDSDHRAVGTHSRGRKSRCARRGGRRLPDQAVRLGRTAGTRPGASATPSAGSDGRSQLAFGAITVDLGKRLVEKGGEQLHLTPIEFRLLAYLVANPDCVLTHRQLLKAVWGPSHAEDSHYVRVYMGHLRKKLEADPANPDHIVTEPGIGYRFVADP